MVRCSWIGKAAVDAGSKPLKKGGMDGGCEWCVIVSRSEERSSSGRG